MDAGLFGAVATGAFEAGVDEPAISGACPPAGLAAGVPGAVANAGLAVGGGDPASGGAAKATNGMIKSNKPKMNRQKVVLW
ncbi:hypothetical protein SpAn4DRAFT_4636 [Sporomusa ovata]|uniref:Uncharacterized protein n=1 Tax=Sporomusa ovata TaxID=2378 RepID=A0A0U1KTX7_9FIRM|nr:hypothetical protein SpAn4DRAFT_4636 [Sporomusa ovata]